MKKSKHAGTPPGALHVGVPLVTTWGVHITQYGLNIVGGHVKISGNNPGLADLSDLA